MRIDQVLGVWFAILLGLLIIYSCSASGSGPDYKGPGIEIDVDKNKKATPKGGHKKPGYTSKRR